MHTGAGQMNSKEAADFFGSTATELTFPFQMLFHEELTYRGLAYALVCCGWAIIIWGWAIWGWAMTGCWAITTWPCTGWAMA